MPLPFPSRGLYAITGDIQDFEALKRQLANVLAGGARVVQLRDKQRRLDAGCAKQLLELCHQHGVPFIVNDDIALAAEIGADGVHLGREDTDPKEARNLLGKEAIIGISCYADLERALEAERQGATYVAFGAFFPSASKPQAKPAPLSLLTVAREALNCPIVAIGGITPGNGGQLIQAGAGLLAVISGLFGRNDPLRASREYARLFPAGAATCLAGPRHSKR